MTFPQLSLLRLEHCDIATVETSETSTVCVETRQMSALAKDLKVEAMAWRPQSAVWQWT